MDLIGKVAKRTINEDGEMELTLVLPSVFHQSQARELKKDITYKISIKEQKETRSIKQNAYMWEIIHKIAIARGSERATNDDWEIYLEALERSGAKTEYLAITKKGLEMLKKTFRAVKEYNTFTTEKGVEMVQCKVFVGSSKMNTAEMNLLLETIEDMAIECNVPVDYERGF